MMVMEVEIVASDKGIVTLEILSRMMIITGIVPSSPWLIISEEVSWVSETVVALIDVTEVRVIHPILAVELLLADVDEFESFDKFFLVFEWVVFDQVVNRSFLCLDLAESSWEEELLSFVRRADLFDGRTVYRELLLRVRDVFDVWTSIEGVGVLLAEVTLRADVPLTPIDRYVVFDELILLPVRGEVVQFREEVFLLDVV